MYVSKRSGWARWVSIPHYFLLALALMSLSSNVDAKPVLNIQHWQTTNGVPVYFVAAKELPMVDIAVVFDAGSGRDAQQPGLAQLTNAMLDQGTAALNADQIADGFDSVGAQFSNTVTRDKAVVSLRSLTAPRYLTPALQLFTQVLSTPHFPQDQFSRMQQQVLVALKQQDQQPNAIAAKALFAGLYGNHPYAHPVLGTPKAVAQLTPADLQRFYQHYYVASNAFMVMVGDLTNTQAQQLANEITAHWPQGAAPPPLPKPSLLAQATQRTISFPSEQTHILLGQVVPLAYRNPDYFAMLLDNYVLGGAELTSRLFTQIREQRGLAYNVGSYLLPLGDSSLYLINLQTRNGQAATALQLAQQTLAAFVKQGPTVQELRTAQNNAIQGFPLQLASNSDIVANVITIVFYHLPLNYLDTYRANIQAVTLAQAKTALQRYIDPQRLLTVTVGTKLPTKTIVSS